MKISKRWLILVALAAAAMTYAFWSSNPTVVA